MPKPQRTGAEFLPNDAEFSSCFTEGQTWNFCSHPSVSATQVTNPIEFKTSTLSVFDRQSIQLRSNKHLIQLELFTVAARHLGFVDTI